MPRVTCGQIRLTPNCIESPYTVPELQLFSCPLRRIPSALAMSDAYILHRIIRRLAGWAVWSFFTEVHVIGEENVPKEGPIIV